MNYYRVISGFDLEKENIMSNATMKKIKLIRKKLEVTQRQLAALLRCTQTCVYLWEKGETDPSEYLQERLNALCNNKRLGIKF